MVNGWWQHSRVHQTFNTHFDSDRQDQVGGTSIMIADKLAHRVKEILEDETGLGRWTSMCVEGKNGFKTRIISAYRPCKSYGLETAYTQHLLYFQSVGEDREPRQAFMDDLKTAIQAWQNDGEEIILTGDFNTGDKKTPQEKDRFWNTWLSDLGLVDVHQTHLK
jgi:exonuclease III